MIAEPDLLLSHHPLCLPHRISKSCFVLSSQDIRQAYHFQEQPLGAGSFGSVYKATLKEAPYSQRAIKVIPKKNFKHAAGLRQEVEILKKVDHPGMVKIYEYYESSKAFYLVLDLWEGGTLFDHIQENGALCQDQAKILFRQILRAVSYLHSHKICHRDIKLENLLFDKAKRNLGIADFGLAIEWKNSLARELRKSAKNQSVGTAAYVAPEVLQRNYDERCDIWSLGVTLYMMATAHHPFRGNCDREIMDKVSKIQIDKNPSFFQLSTDLQNLILGILAPQEQRLTLKQILQHPWMQVQVSRRIPRLNYARLKNFASYSKLKKVISGFMVNLLPSEDVEDFKQSFNEIASFHKGTLTVTEIEVALKAQGIQVETPGVQEILELIDLDKDGQISFNEFVAVSIGEQYFSSQSHLWNIFKYFNIDSTGTISLEELQDQLAKMGVEKPRRLGREIMREADLDEDGVISYKDFSGSIQEEGAPTSESEDDSFHS